MNYENLLHNIALTMVPEVGPILSKYLISYCGNAENVFKSSSKKLAKIPGIGPKVIESLKNATPFEKAEKQIEFIDRNECKIYLFHDDDYPKRLKHFEASPLVLYGKGAINTNHRRTVAIIGTRSPTELGKINCEKIVQGLKKYNVQIISGLAYGIDTCAHKSSVEKDIETVGILGHGLDKIYPASNKPLVKKMIQNGGILTEFPIKTRPDRENFPMRNRIIAAMSDAVIVVESKRSGGSIITTEFANSYNKDVFAVPGRVNDEVSEGCNKLIKQTKAHLLESAEDIGYIMRWEEMDSNKTIQPKLFVDLNDEEQRVVDLLKTEEEYEIDKIAFSLALSTSQLASILLNLEFKGVIKSLPGNSYMLI